MSAESQAEPEVRWGLVNHIREQIKKDPLGYANDAKFVACLDKILADLRYDKAMDENDHAHHQYEPECPCYTCTKERNDS